MSAVLRLPDDLYLAKLKESGLTLADAAELGFEHLAPERSFALRLWRTPLPALKLPYANPWLDEPPWDFYRARCLQFPTPKPQKFPKYVQPAGSPVHAYFPTMIDWVQVLTDAAQDIIITEGELKAACATKMGFPTVGLGGDWSFRSKKHGIWFLPELERVAWADRRVFIIYDSDAALKPDVLRARQALANELIYRGAECLTVDLPQAGSAKVGLDDFLVAEGPDELKNLLLRPQWLELDWKFFYQDSGAGPASNLANACVALEHAPELKDCFAYDRFNRHISVRCALPEEPAVPLPRRFEDSDVLLVQQWLQREGGLPRIATELVRGAIQLRAQQLAFHPVQDFLSQLSWDNKDRTSTWLQKAFGVAPSRYAQAIGRMFLIAMVARVFEPGCQADYMMVLEGDQGLGKSTACRLLSNGWFADHLKDPEKHDARASMHLRGKWLIEVAELSALRRTDVEHVKAFITRREEIYTPLYGREQVCEPRQCLLVGTTNDTAYLRDDTGNRRFWPVTVTRVDIEWLRLNRDQLLAEALARYQKGEPHYPNAAFELEHIAPEQQRRFVGDSWDEDVQIFLDILLRNDPDPKVTTREIALGQLGMDAKQFTTETGRRLASCLKRLGWTVETRSQGLRKFSPGPDIARPAKAPKIVPLRKKY